MSGTLTVNRARVPRDAATRSDVERWFARVPVERLGLAADETFYVPRLGMRIPAQGGAANGRIPDLLLEALRAQLAAAGLGWRDRFAPGQAYRFASRSRYFAWLTSLWVRDGSPAARGAFAAATGHTALGPWQRATVLRDGPALVTTIAHLAEIGCAARWLARFESADIALAERAIETAFALPLRAPLQSGSAMPEARLAEAQAPRMRATTSRTGASSSETLFRAIVAALARNGNAWIDLPPPARALLLAAAVVARLPARPARDATPLAAAIAAYAERPEPGLNTPNAPSDALITPAAPMPPQSAFRPMAEPPRARSTPPPPPLPRTAPAMPAAHPESEPPAPPSTASPPPQLPDQAAPTAPTRPTSAPRISSNAAPPEPLLAPDLCFDTGFGGLLFLINAFVALDLYPDFSRPCGPRLDPSPLWLADRIGRYHFGLRYRRDPLATWIAANAAPGRLPATWRANPEWLAGFDGAAAPRLTLHRGRATLWHPAGFPLFDGKPQALPRQRRTYREALRPPRLPARHRWAACLALYLDARLRLLAGGGLTLLEQPAQIRIRDLQLHADFDLARHPIGLRIAGLDRDPGWQPAEGRQFSFGFA